MQWFSELKKVAYVKKKNKKNTKLTAQFKVFQYCPPFIFFPEMNIVLCI